MDVHYQSRLLRLRQILQKNNTDGIFVTDPLNILYLTGFRGLSPEEREVSLYFDHKSASLFLPRMYEEQGKSLKAVEEGSVTCVIDYERDGILTKWLQSVSEGNQVFIEAGNLKVSEYRILEQMKRIVLKESLGIVETMRIIKDSVEIACVKDVVKKTDAVFNEVLNYLNTHDYLQLTELDIVDLLRKLGREHGLLEFSFEPIIACGAGASEPHYRTKNKPLKRGDVLLMDFGFRLNGYNSDLTRTLVLGKATDEMQKMYQLVLEGNQQSIASVKPGMETGTLHQNAVMFFKKQNIDQFFIHGLGHGIGLDIHEEPYFRVGHKTVLQPGMAITIEPGLYFPGKYGIRIEDFVVVTETGGDVLSDGSPRELIEVS